MSSSISGLCEIFEEVSPLFPLDPSALELLIEALAGSYWDARSWRAISLYAA